MTFCSNSLLYETAMVAGFMKPRLNRGKHFESKNTIEMEVTAFIP